MAQANSKEGPDWIAWNNPDSRDLGLLAVRSVEASRKQGIPAFKRMHMGLLKAHHEGKMDLSLPETIYQVARDVELDLSTLTSDIEETDIRQVLGESHIKASTDHGVFGVPTFLLRDGSVAFIKTFLPPKGAEVPMFESLLELLTKWKYIGEFKRPQPPWPQGVFI